MTDKQRTQNNPSSNIKEDELVLPDDRVPLIRKVKLNPRALFEILRNLSSNPPHRKGLLYGYLRYNSLGRKSYSDPVEPKSDETNEEQYIEVVSSFPEYEEKSVYEEKFEFLRGVIDTHGGYLKSLNQPGDFIGYYTSDNIGGRPADGNGDIRFLLDLQSGKRNIFLLVISASSALFSVRAFRLHENANDCLKRSDNFKDSYHFEEEFFHANLFDELNVSFELSDFEQNLLSSMLSGFNLVSSILKLNDLSSIHDQVSQLSSDLDDCENYADKVKQHISSENVSSILDKGRSEEVKADYINSLKNLNAGDSLQIFPNKFQFKVYEAASRSLYVRDEVQSERKKLELTLAFSSIENDTK